LHHHRSAATAAPPSDNGHLALAQLAALFTNGHAALNVSFDSFQCKVLFEK